jgi:ubiquinone/menaquinone biosynthesis C-methylase UbiE
MGISGLNEQVRTYWEAEPCGTSPAIVGAVPSRTREWFERVEEHRYATEPFIHSVAQFTRGRGKRVLEVGVGAGTDHLQWARAGAECYGVDLTDAAIETTRSHLALHGLESNLLRVDAEVLPFQEEMFDIVYSWGVIHHSAHPMGIIAEIRRVLKPGGQFVGMMYGRRSVAAFKTWVRRGLLAGKPWRTFKDVLAHHCESPGTKAYTPLELEQMFSAFSEFSAEPLVTAYDRSRLPAWLGAYLPNSWGWFIALKATR